MVARGPLYDDMAKMMTNMAGVAQGVRREAQTAFISYFERWLAERDIPTREELETIRDMARAAREENETLAARIDTLEKQLKPKRAASSKRKSAKTEDRSE